MISGSARRIKDEAVASVKTIKLQDRYELGEVLGRGGMGVVYRAFDKTMQRDVALKTILDIENLPTLELFYKECGILAAMVHPNIISIYDVGEFEVEGVRKPFFVMPLLPGASLDKLIKDGNPSFNVEKLVEILVQASHGLHAAHEMGLIHRDVKPSNIFVMRDFSVKLIDFGIARAASAHSRTNLKGTLHYMAPEQLQMKAPSPLCDQYSLAVVCYEALTRRKPFQGASEAELVDSILRSTPPPVSDLNRSVSYAVSQVIHKALAKQPLHRFFNTREFGEALQKALRNEPLEQFDESKIKPRLDRAAESFEKGDCEFASEVLAELEAEGYLDQEITLLRRSIDQRMKMQQVQKLLDNAVRYFNAHEYPLALRKIQEALDLDPEHSDALSLKNRVEKERREKKIDEWIALAQRHINNQSFHQAREALDNILKLKPNETEALQLMAEVGRREQGLAKAREKKATMYEAAMQSWERGDITAALSKLDNLMGLERELPDTETNRGSTYQSFYNKVRSEYDTLRNSYEEARRELAAENFEAGLAICKQHLAKYPNHALFQALKFDIEQRTRQKLSALIAETDRRVDEDPDLDRRLAVLEEAAARYPEEPHFIAALKSVRDKRDLVNSIVNKAQYFEERSQFNDALDQWQILRTIHESYPGLSFEIERVMKRREQQSRHSAKARFVEEIDRHLEAGDYSRAQEAVHAAKAEFPDDPEIPELDKLVKKSAERSGEALLLLKQARELADSENLEESLPLLRRAQKLEPQNSVIRTVLVNSLLDQANLLLRVDLDAAEGLLRELLQIQPNHSAAQSLLSQISDRKHEDLVSWCATQARRMQTDGDFDGALVLVKKGLDSYPQEKVLLQLQSTLKRAKNQAELTGSQILSPPSGIEPTKKEPPAPQVLVTKVDPPTVIMPPPPPPEQPSAVPGRGRWQSIPPKHRLVIAGGGAGILTLVVLAGGFTLLRKKAEVNPAPAPSAAGVHQVSIKATPAYAAIIVDGKACGIGSCDAPLSDGNHDVAAEADGFLRASRSITISGQDLAPVDLTLEARLTLLQVSSNLIQSAVGVDKNPSAPLVNGEIRVPDLPAGERMLTFRGEGLRSEIPIIVTPGAIPTLKQPLGSQAPVVAIATVLGSTGKLVSTLTGADVQLDGKPLGKIDANGMNLSGLSKGSHELTVSANSGMSMRLTFESGPGPALVAFFGADRNLGTLNVTTDLEDVDVFVNGRKLGRTTKTGKMTLYLPQAAYNIKVSKDGYQPAPAQNADVKQRQQSALQFQLVKIPTSAVLSVHGAPSGADVTIDDRRVGTTGADGSFSLSGIDPGRHSVAIRKDRFRPRTADLNFTAGATVDVDGTLNLALGTLRISVSPTLSTPSFTIQRDGEPARTIVDRTQSVPEGDYTITAKAQGQPDATVRVHVTAGREQAVALTFRATQAQRPAPKTPRQGLATADLEKSMGFAREDSYLIRRGGGLTQMPLPAGPASITFTARVQKGKRLEWVLVLDDNSTVLYQLDGERLTRTVTTDGSPRGVVTKATLKIPRDKWFTVTIGLNEDSIATGAAPGDQHDAPVDQLTGRKIAAQKFGFRIPGKDEILVSDFRFTPH